LGENHICPFSEVHLQKDFPNLAFVHLKLSSSQASCVPCFEAEKDQLDGLCPIHTRLGRDNKIDVIACAVTFESGQRETFETIYMVDSALGVATEEEGAQVKIPYLPKFGRDFTQLSRKKNPIRFGTSVSSDPLLDARVKRLERKSNKTVMECFLAKVLTPEFTNYSFVFSLGSHIQLLLTTLVQNDFVIDKGIIVKNTNIMLLPFPSLGVRFISCANFGMEGTFSDLANMFNLPKQTVFFPESLSSTLAKDIKTTPALEAFQDLGDSEDVAKEKLTYWLSVRSQPWSFTESLRETCLSELKIHVSASISLLRSSMEFQQDCEQCLGKPDRLQPKHAPVLHLYFFVSLASFIHNVFRLYALSRYPMYAIMPAKKPPVSVMETEYMSYLCHLYPKQYLTAFSSDEGQRTLRKKDCDTIVPDAFGINDHKNKLVFFHGCW
jgi:hypothetical protein